MEVTTPPQATDAPKRRGRKPLPPERRRTTFVGIRLSEAEAARLRVVAAEHRTTVSNLTRLLYRRIGV
jgi:hypothetical protein